MAGIWCTRTSIAERPHTDTSGVAPGGIKKGSKHIHCAGSARQQGSWIQDSRGRWGGSAPATCGVGG